MSGRVALITGVGPGTGSATVRRFAAGGYQVAMLARTGDRLLQLEKDVPGTHAFPTDMTDIAQVDDTLAQVTRKLGAPNVVVHNAVGGAFGNFMDIDPEILQRNFAVNVMAFLHLARKVAPAMVEAGQGAIIATGNTSALRGKANFAGFAPTKAAQRILAESMARELGPKGVHVSYLVIDAVIDVPWTRQRYRDAADDFFIKPAAIADEIWHLSQQDKSAWTFLAEVRPFRESW